MHSLTGDSIVVGVANAPSDGRWKIWVVEEQIPVTSLPFVYAGEGEVRSPPFWLEKGDKYKLTFTTTWDGNFTIGWRDTKNKQIFYLSTGRMADFPRSVVAGKTYEYVLNWGWPTQAVYFNVEHAPPVSN